MRKIHVKDQFPFVSYLLRSTHMNSNFATRLENGAKIHLRALNNTRQHSALRFYDNIRGQ